jgi:hypothetical protein
MRQMLFVTSMADNPDFDFGHAHNVCLQVALDVGPSLPFFFHREEGQIPWVGPISYSL